MTEILRDCPNCKGSKYCISKPNKNDYKFPEEENQYLMDLECGIWDCHTAVIKLLKKNEQLKADLEEAWKHCKAVDEVNVKLRCCGNCKHSCSTMKCFNCVDLSNWEMKE